MTIGFEITAAVSALAALAIYVVVHQRKRTRENARAQADLDAWKLRLEQDLKRARDERNRLLDALGDAFLLVDDHGYIRFANSAARQLFGDRDLSDRPVREAFVDPRLAASVLRCLETGESIQSRVVLPQQTSPRGDQETRGLNAWIVDAARMDEDSIGGASTRIVIRDVTSEHQTEQIRKDFVANASHELRTPMAIINGYLENLLDDDMVEEPAMARRFLTVMRKHAERISRIVEDMLVISRLESGEAAALKVTRRGVLAAFPSAAEIAGIVARHEGAEA